MTTQQTNNIINFPTNSNPNRKVSSRKEAENSLEETKQYYIQQTLNFLTPIIFSQLEIAGFAPDDPDDLFTIKEGAFILESLRSRMYSHYGLYHPLQKVVNKFFVPDKSEEGLLTITDRLSINFKEKDV
jgi:hypothetical protein